MGGHGGLNILPQKKWNVYNWDNRHKVDADRTTLENARARKQQKEASDSLRGKVSQLKGETTAQAQYEEVKAEDIDDQTLFLEERGREKREAKKAKKQVERKMLATTVSSEDHINLFQAQEMANAMKQREKDFDREAPKTKHEYDKYSGTLGSLFPKQNKPWYAQPSAKTKVAMKVELPEQEQIDKKESKKDRKEKKREKKRREKEERKAEKKKLKAEIQALRKERLQREAAERRRRDELL